MSARCGWPLCNVVKLREVYPVVVTQMQGLNGQLQILDRSAKTIEITFEKMSLEACVT